MAFSETAPESSNSQHVRQEHDIISNGDEDRLLKSGTFIHNSDANCETPKERVSVSSYAIRRSGRSSKAAKKSNVVDEASPPSMSPRSTDSTPETVKRSKRKRGSEPSSTPTSVTDWLPMGWQVVEKIRTAGASAGSMDKYYVNPESGHHFRSRNEVLRFLETGSKSKRQFTKDNTNGNDGTINARGRTRRGSGFRAKNTPSPSFDFASVPAKVKWELTDVTEGTWTAFVGGQMVPEAARQEWVSGFESLMKGDVDVIVL